MTGSEPTPQVPAPATSDVFETYYCPQCGRDYVDAAPEEVAAWTRRGYCCDYCQRDAMPSATTPLTTPELVAYAEARFHDGLHLAHELLLEAHEGRDPAQLAAESARRGAYLSAYFADCIMRLHGGEVY